MKDVPRPTDPSTQKPQVNKRISMLISSSFSFSRHRFVHLN